MELPVNLGRSREFARHRYPDRSCIAVDVGALVEQSFVACERAGKSNYIDQVYAAVQLLRGHFANYTESELRAWAEPHLARLRWP